MSRAKWLIILVVLVAILGGCKGRKDEARSPREVPREAVAAPEAPASPPAQMRTVVCWDGTEVEIPAWAEFIGNKGSGKFHRLTCQYVPGRKNHLYFKTRAEAIAAGQVACKVCSP